ncbi:dual specificity protein phosphatase family protein [Candidatus Micrarchaeota archaeon]|nr:dual specificity protein phosphatase family protein [Candidatus Micrarchaeota archaeon]
MQDHHPKPAFEYSKISEHVYIGTNQCCQGHFNRQLLSKGISADVSLEETRIDQPFGVQYYLWLPTRDHAAPSFKQLLVGARFIQQLAANGVKTYVHCQHGHGRAPALVAAYLVLEGKTSERAFELIKRKRPGAHPNAKQLRAVEEFQKVISNGKSIKQVR